MRNAEFDRTAVLRSAMAAFMNKGYGKTSMPDLSKATGLHPGSIYCAFNNKRGLLIASLEQYKQDRNAQFLHFFAGTEPRLVALKNYLNNTVSECLSSETKTDCLAIKALNEVAGQDQEILMMITKSQNDWQQVLAGIFEQAKVAGELTTKRESAHLARVFVMGIYGLRIFAQTRPQAEILQQLADQLYHDLCAE